MPSPFPLEVWHQAILTLHETGSLSALSALARTHKDFTPEAQRWIFHTVTVRLENLDIISAVLQGSRTSSHLIPLVRHLSHYSTTGSESVPANWQTRFASLIKTLSVDSLSSFTLQAHGGVDWGSLIASRRRSKAKWLPQIVNECPNLQHLKLYMDHPHVIFPYFEPTKLQKLKTLVLLGGYIPTLDKRYFSSVGNPNVHLEYLHLNSVGEFNDVDRLVFLAPKDLPFPVAHLKKLSLTLFEQGGHNFLYRLLSRCSTTLEELTLNYPSESMQGDRNGVIPHPFPRLHTLNINGLRMQKNERGLLAQVASLWGIATDLQSLKQIHLSVIIGMYEKDYKKTKWDPTYFKIDGSGTFDTIGQWATSIPSLDQVDIRIAPYAEKGMERVGNVVELLRTLAQRVTGIVIQVEKAAVSNEREFEASFV
ncbi:hypothetical protein DL96DRAFT_1617975 [Flagelloscypha sp. PMI_526]|nr:hypothetical protein DL96DRAFT_1617975 [Flagelloscypha sp. PMI_526]